MAHCRSHRRFNYPMNKTALPPTAPTTSTAKRRTLRAIALFEAFKGIAVFAASIGMLSLLHQDLRTLALELIAHFGMKPTAHYPAILLHYAEVLQDANLRALVFMATGYVILRLFEAYGLWRDRAWAEWLGALSGAIYIPFEINHFMHQPTATSAMIFMGNIFIVGFLAFQLRRRHLRRTRGF